MNYPSGEKLHKRCFPCIVETQKCLGYISLTKKSLYDEIVRYAKNIRSVKKMSSPGGLSCYKVQGSGATTEPSQEARNSKIQTYLDVQATIFGNFWLFTILDDTGLTSIFYKLWLWWWLRVLTQCMVQWCRLSIAPRRRRVKAGDEITCRFLYGIHRFGKMACALLHLWVICSRDNKKTHLCLFSWYSNILLILHMEWVTGLGERNGVDVPYTAMTTRVTSHMSHGAGDCILVYMI